MVDRNLVYLALAVVDLEPGGWPARRGFVKLAVDLELELDVGPVGPDGPRKFCVADDVGVAIGDQEIWQTDNLGPVIAELGLDSKGPLVDDALALLYLFQGSLNLVGHL